MEFHLRSSQLLELQPNWWLQVSSPRGTLLFFSILIHQDGHRSKLETVRSSIEGQPGLYTALTGILCITCQVLVKDSGYRNSMTESHCHWKTHPTTQQKTCLPKHRDVILSPSFRSGPRAFHGPPRFGFHRLHHLLNGLKALHGFDVPQAVPAC